MENCFSNLFHRNKKKPEELKVTPKKLVVLHDPMDPEIWPRYELGSEIERGDFGIMYECKDRITGQELACKTISKNELRTANDVEEVRREVAIMRRLPKHLNIASLMDTYEDDDEVHLVMELCEGGKLSNRIGSRGYYTERSAASLVKNIVQVVQICHKHCVMLRDLKPENFFFSAKKLTSPLKVIDFRLSTFFKPGERFNEIVGSPNYMAPEVLKKNYGPEIDIWSAGVILYFLLGGVPPAWAETKMGVGQEILRYLNDFKRDPWLKVSDDAKDLVKKMLNPDPKHRLTAQEVLDHPWLQNEKTTPNISLGDRVRAKLMQFSVMKKIKEETSRALLILIEEHLSVEEVARLKERFQVLDPGYKGKIKIDQLQFRLHKLGYQIPYGDLQTFMEVYDTGKGYLDYEQLLAISIHLRKNSCDRQIKWAFNFFDKNQSGYIELEELRNALADEVDTNSEEIIDAIMHEVDTNKDGKISYYEFTNLCMELTKEVIVRTQELDS